MSSLLKASRRALLVVAASAVAVAPHAQTADSAPDLDRLRASTVRVVATIDVPGEDPIVAGHGSGFLIEGGLVVTNAHVILDLDFLLRFPPESNPLRASPSDFINLRESLQAEDVSVVVYVVEGSDRPVSTAVVATSPLNDLAILRPTAPLKRPAAPLAPADSVQVGMDVYVSGFPGAADRIRPGSADLDQFLASTQYVPPGVTTGTINNLYPDQNGRWLVQTDAAINPGNSGGPVFDARGRVVGIAVERADADDVGFAVHVAELAPLLRSIGSGPPPDDAVPTSGAPPVSRGIWAGTTLLASVAAVALFVVAFRGRSPIHDAGPPPLPGSEPPPLPGEVAARRPGEPPPLPASNTGLDGESSDIGGRTRPAPAPLWGAVGATTIAVVAGGLWALGPRVDIAGHVSAPSGEPLAGVRVVVAGPGGEETTETGPNGRFAVRWLRPETEYTVRAEKDGWVFRSGDATQVALVPTGDVQLDYVGITEEVALSTSLEEGRSGVERGIASGDRSIAEAGVDALTQALELQPEHTEARYLRARGRWFVADYEGCVEDLGQLTGDERAGGMLPWCQLGAGRLDQAREGFERRAEGGSTADQLIGLSLVAQKQDRDDDAMRHYIAAVDTEAAFLDGQQEVTTNTLYRYNADEWEEIDRLRRDMLNRVESFYTALADGFTEAPKRGLRDRADRQGIIRLLRGGGPLHHLEFGGDEGTLALARGRDWREEIPHRNAAIRVHYRVVSSSHDAWTDISYRDTGDREEGRLRHVVRIWNNGTFRTWRQTGEQSSWDGRLYRSSALRRGWNQIEVALEGGQVNILFNGVVEATRQVHSPVGRYVALATSQTQSAEFDNLVAVGIP